MFSNLPRRLISGFAPLLCAATLALLAGCASPGMRAFGISRSQNTVMTDRPPSNVWYAGWGAGKKPSRMAVYFQEGMNGIISHGPDGAIVPGMVRNVDVMIIHESAKEPDSISKNS